MPRTLDLADPLLPPGFRSEVRRVPSCQLAKKRPPSPVVKPTVQEALHVTQPAVWARPWSSAVATFGTVQRERYRGDPPPTRPLAIGTEVRTRITGRILAPWYLAHC